MKISENPIVIKNPNGEILFAKNINIYNNKLLIKENLNNENLNDIDLMFKKMFIININCSLIKIIIFIDFLIGIKYNKNSLNILDILINIFAFHSTVSLNKMFLLPFLTKYYLLSFSYFIISISCYMKVINNNILNNNILNISYILFEFHDKLNNNINCFYNNIIFTFYLLNTFFLQRFYLKVPIFRLIYEDLIYQHLLY